MKTILLIMIGLSSLSMAQDSRFTREDGVVTDNKTTLEWQDEYGDSIKSYIWTDAIDYCEMLTLNGKEDWRLPNKKELLSIVDYDTYKPSIDSVFQNTSFYSYWSSTTYAKDTDYVFVVEFGIGYIFVTQKSARMGNVRCVRAGE